MKCLLCFLTLLLANLGASLESQHDTDLSIHTPDAETYLMRRGDQPKDGKGDASAKPKSTSERQRTGPIGLASNPPRTGRSPPGSLPTSHHQTSSVDHLKFLLGQPPPDYGRRSTPETRQQEIERLWEQNPTSKQHRYRQRVKGRAENMKDEHASQSEAIKDLVCMNDGLCHRLNISPTRERSKTLRPETLQTMHRVLNSENQPPKNQLPGSGMGYTRTGLTDPRGGQQWQQQPQRSLLQNRPAQRAASSGARGALMAAPLPGQMHSPLATGFSSSSLPPEFIMPGSVSRPRSYGPVPQVWPPSLQGHILPTPLMTIGQSPPMTGRNTGNTILGMHAQQATYLPTPVNNPHSGITTLNSNFGIQQPPNLPVQGQHMPEFVIPQSAGALPYQQQWQWLPGGT